MKELELIRDILSEITDAPKESINLETRFIDLPDWDSLRAISFLAYCESAFGVSFPLSIMSKVNTVGELVDAIR